MFDAEVLKTQFANLLGWKQHYDTNEIDLPTALTNSDTNEFYQQKHPALRLDIIQTTLPPNYSLETYLRDVVTESTHEIFNDIIQYRGVKEYGRNLLSQSTLLDKYGWSSDTITNQNRFVGFQIKVKNAEGLKAVIEQLGLQFTQAGTFKMYLFHSSKTDPIVTPFDVTSIATGWSWIKQELDLAAFKSADYAGGVFVLGYYQEDISGNAINMTDFNWNKGYCGSCTSGRGHYGVWQSIKKHFSIFPVYVPNGSYTKEKMFDLRDSILSSNESWGMNLRLSVRCDLTEFFVRNKTSFKNLLALKVTHKVLNMMKFSQQINAVEENIKMMIIRDLEGDVDTKLLNIPTLYHKEMKSVSFDTSGINDQCLACNDKGYTPVYGSV